MQNEDLRFWKMLKSNEFWTHLNGTYYLFVKHDVIRAKFPNSNHEGKKSAFINICIHITTAAAQHSIRISYEERKRNHCKWLNFKRKSFHRSGFITVGQYARFFESRKNISANNSDRYTLYCAPNAWCIEILFFIRFVSYQNNYGLAPLHEVKVSWKVKPPTTNHHSSIVAQNEKCIFRAKALDVLTCSPIHLKLSVKNITWLHLTSQYMYIITLTGMRYRHGFLFVCGRMIEYFRKEICTFLMVFHRHDWHQVKYVKS